MRQQQSHRQHGVTLVELVIVIMLAGIVAATLTVFLKPAIDSFTDMRARADLADQSDTALRRMLRDVRRAVPNSLRVPSSSCFELVPIVSGGRYRMGPDVANEAGCTPSDNGVTSTCAAWVDPSQSTTTFDVLSSMSVTPSANDWVVINNQNGNDVYTGANTRQISGTPAAPPTTTKGTLRITMSSPMQVSPGYTGGRFQTISNNEQSVFYICSGAAYNSATGNGSGTLYRLVRPFNAAYPTSCPSTAGAVVLATNVQACTFVYDPNQGGTQQSGFLSMTLELARNKESAKMVMGAHVMNVP
jgi:MSHA biogenesis protein MshO